MGGGDDGGGGDGDDEVELPNMGVGEMMEMCIPYCDEEDCDDDGGLLML